MTKSEDSQDFHISPYHTGFSYDANKQLTIKNNSLASNTSKLTHFTHNSSVYSTSIISFSRFIVNIQQICVKFINPNLNNPS